MQLQTTPIRVLLLGLCLAFTILAQVPCTPVGGSGPYPIMPTLMTHTYTDGYQVEAVLRAPNIGGPPACGWPLVVCVHGGGGDKSVVANLAANIAERGYVTLAYDVRGQGPSMALNNPNNYGATVGKVRELIDLFEIMEAAEAAFPNQIDFTRIGVTGYSQGGTHSWWAAANSGRLPPPNPWRQAAFPVISAAIPRDSAGPGFGPRPGAELGISDVTVNKLFGAPGGIWILPAQKTQLENLVLAEDYQAIANWRTNPALDPAVLLPASQVPVLAHVSYDDYRVPTSGVLASWQLLSPVLPKRLMGGTGGHNSPSNACDRERFNRLRMRWLDRFLKDLPNGVAQEAPVRLAVTPDDLALYNDNTGIWDARRMNDVPSGPTVLQTLFLAGGGTMIGSAPAGAGSATLNHNPPAGASMATYVTQLPNAAQLVSAFGLNSLEWTSAPLSQDRHLQGEAEIELEVTTMDPRFQIHAILQDVDPQGNARYVADGFIRVRDNLPAGTNTLTFGIYLQSYVFRAGHGIRLRLENLAIHRPPTGNGQMVRSVPAFDASSVDVELGGANPSRITLPFAPIPSPRLITCPLGISVASAADQRFAIHTSSAEAGEPYLFLLGQSGTQPGIPIVGSGVVFPLNLDALMLFVLANISAPPFVDFAGVMDGRGYASPSITLGGAALDPALIGTEFQAAALVGTFGGGLQTTNPVSVPFIP